MPPSGADVAALERLGAAMSRAARVLAHAAPEQDRRVRALRWHGPDARRFVASWAATAAQLRRAATLLESLADQLRRQADQQRSASAGGPPLRAGGDPPRPRAGGADAPVRGGRLLEPLPRSEVRYAGGVGAELGLFGADLSGELVLQRLGGGRTRVVLTEAAVIGAGVGAGAHASLDAGGASLAAPGATAELEAHLGPIERRTWEVAEREVPGLLARLGLERTSLLRTGMRDPLRTAGGLVDRLARAATGVDPGLDDRLGGWVGAPEPMRVERLGAVAAAAGAAAWGPGGAVGGGAQGEATLRAGVAASPGAHPQRSLVLEARHGAAATLGTRFAAGLGLTLPTDLASVVSARLEVPIDAPAGRPVLLHLQEGSGSHRTEARVAVLVPPRTATAVAAAAQALLRGDEATASTLLARLDPSRIRTEVSIGGVTVREDAAGASGAVAAIGRLGVEVRGQRSELRR